MYSWIVFLLTLVQLALAGGSLAFKADELFSLVAIYGSPFYLVMHLTTLLESHVLYIALFAYHMLKYFFFFCAQMRSEQNILFFLAIIFEATYLGISGYHLN